jgi:hypothetical protein
MKTSQKATYVPVSQETIDFVDKSAAPHVGHDLTYNETFDWYGYSPYFEIITPNSGGGRRVWKDFEHYKIVQGSKGPTTVPIRTKRWGLPHTHEGRTNSIIAGYRTYNGVGNLTTVFGDAGRLNSGLPAMYVARADGGFVPPPADIVELQEMSMKTMLPSVHEDLSVLNAVYELKDFKRLPSTIRRLKGLKSLFKGRFTVLSTLAELTKRGADLYLTHEFGIAPLISDVQNLKTALLRVEGRINDLITRGGKVNSAHYTHKFIENVDVKDEPTEGGWIQPYQAFSTTDLWRTVRNVRYSPSVFHAQIDYNANYNQFQVQYAGLLSLLDRVGINFDPSIIWNAVPYTFLVDWVVDVNRFLQQFEVQNMKPRVNVLRYLWSIKRSRSISCRREVVLSNNDTTLVGHQVHMPEVVESSYRRNATMPNMSLISTSGLTSKEVSLGAALLSTRSRTRRKRVSKNLFF